MAGRSAIIVLAVSIPLFHADAGEASIASANTRYDTRTCHHRAGRDVEDYGSWRCRGLDGTAVLIGAGDQRTTMSFGSHARDEPAAGQTLQGFNEAYQGDIEWRFVPERGRRTRPFAAIVRWRTTLPEQTDGKEPGTVHGQVLVVTRLGPGGVCHVGYVDALANRNANELARRIADARARAFRCGVDKPLIAGETGPGFSSSADAEKVDLGPD
jgi:hypothetical protein